MEDDKDNDPDYVKIDRLKFDLPKHFTHFRKQQLECAEITAELLNTGTDVVIVEATVGFGKGLMAVMVSQLLNRRMLYMAPKNELINQMTKAFPYAKPIKGRVHYPNGLPQGERDFRLKKSSCADCVKGSLCDNTGKCKYKVDRWNFIKAPQIGITNTSYYMVAAKYLNMFNPFGDPEYIKDKDGNPTNKKLINWKSGDYITVFDEASSLKHQILGFFDITITQKFLQEVIDKIGSKDKLPIPPVRNFDTWMEWWIDAHEIIKKAIKYYGPLTSNDDLARVRWVNRLKKLDLSLSFVESDWIYDPLRAKNQMGLRNGLAESVTLKPIQVGDLGKEVLWKFCGKTILMCGTIVNLNTFARETGLDKSGKSYQLLNYETDWDKWRRTVFRLPGISVVKQRKSQRWQQQPWWDDYIGNIAWILNTYDTERTLIHTVSHELAEDIGKHLGELFGNRIIISKNLSNFKPKSIDGNLFEGLDEDEAEILDRDEALKKYLKKIGSVLVTASATRGTDLPDDLCRNLIIAKIPFPYLGDRRINYVLNNVEGGQMEYLVDTVREILQSTGRGCRHKFDFCRIWILDSQFDRIVKFHGLLPDYFSKSIREPGDYMSKY